MSKKVSILRLAREANVDPDDVLIKLWDAGFIELNSHSDVVRSKRAGLARSILGIENHRVQIRVDYWMTRLGLTRDELTQELFTMGITLSDNSRRLPKGAMKKLQRRFHTESPPAKVVPEKTPTPARPEPCDPLVWRTLGQERQIRYLDDNEVVAVHEALVRDFAAHDDPISPPGVRDQNLLSSAIGRPQTSLGGHLKYPSVEMAGAALLHSIVLNHPFYNGNKRTGLVSLLVFLDKNLVMPTCTEDQLFKLTLEIAQHRLVPRHCDSLADREVFEIAKWVQHHSRRISKELRPIPWLRLKRILRTFHCRIETAGGVGNRIDIYRTVEDKRIFGRSRTRELYTQVAYRGDGTEAARNTVHHIRAELELDEAHGVDSRGFYEAEAEPDEFIQTYRTLLRRLARL